jgi:putative glutamine amidotransferase
MNVAMGGSLHQKIHRVSDMMDHREDSTLNLDGQYGFAHKISITPHGILDQISDDKKPWVNSVHWQGINQLGNGLTVEATSQDGLVESFSVTDSPSFALAVQWHPEWKVMKTPFYKSIFEKFGDACITQG